VDGGTTTRRLLLPLLLVAAVVVALRPQADPPPPPAVEVPADDPLVPSDSADVLAAYELWEAFGPDMVRERTTGLPPGLAVLDGAESMYVLLSVRAAQVARAVQDAAPGADLGKAVAAAGLQPSPPEVRASVLPSRPGCVLLEHSSEPFGRSFFGLADAPEEPGPSPLSALEAVLLRTARIGLAGGVDAATCGQPVVFSPPAQSALEELSPELLR
jgi:hypothetical protein